MELLPETKAHEPATGRVTERLDASRPVDVARAAEILRNGGIVAFPTETVYGLGADALSGTAVEKIFVAKRRPYWDPLIVHIADPEMLATITAVPHDRATIASVNVGRIPPGGLAKIQSLIQKFWPGPLTLLLPRTAAIPDNVTAGGPLVGVRMPAHPVALDLIRQAGIPIAAPSANLFGHTSPTTAAHVLADLDGRIDAVLDGGATTVGLESTVAEVVEGRVRIYRPGAIDAVMLESDRHPAERYLPGRKADSRVEGQPSPGLDLRHYAPRARLVLVGGLSEEEIVRSGQVLERSLVTPIDQAFDATAIVGIMLPDGWDSSCARLLYPWGPWRDGDLLARRLFAGLRELDDRGATIILCPTPTISGIGEAIRDRLHKAARPA